MSWKLLSTLERLLLPNACIACGQAVERRRPDALICTVCIARLAPLVGGCDRCRQPLPPVGPCRFCAEWTASMAWVRSAVWLGEEARAIVHHLKYDGYVALGPDIARVVARHVTPRYPACLIPIPLGHRRLKRRGYNQAEILARALGELWDVPVVPGVLRRLRETGPQTSLDAAAREANVAGAFRASRCPPDVRWSASRSGAKQASVILVDDVLTTGATMSAAAQALLEGGWPEIGAVTFARALPYSAKAVAA
ncbi:MAG: ComF family protein [Gemmatimonadota bacterium]|nr:ComF family protein [Gemmatimonadota bacterium]MDH3368322.1 ComF family protein [Gemmatimonadota bacterium]MDH3479517.1 ComF family protein [Gemmatimonadota bacterium]MDH3571783.1 ComF family protein [Gemmatimonadota bacterium]MDH5549621.1 ComF family protein [Gemmatimonadota bacterium]